MLISSTQNQKIKDLLSLLDKSKVRREKSLFTAEGIREIRQAAAAGYNIRTLFYVPELLSKHGNVTEEFSRLCNDTYEITQQIYAKIAYRESTEGIIAVIKEKSCTLSEITLPENPLVLVLENIEKPGNMGAVLRTADAANADAVFFCDCKTDIYNPNVIRSSLGSVFTRQIAVCSSKEACSWLMQKGINIFTAQLQDSELYYESNMTGPTAIIMGSEDKGLTELWRKNSSGKIRIPMLGKMDSLNVSVSAAILCFEAVRQRLTK